MNEAIKATQRLHKYIERRKRARGLHVEDVHTFDAGGDSEAVLRLSDIESVLAALAQGSENPWQKAVFEQLVVHHIYRAEHEADPRKAINDLLCYSNQLALDPQVSSDAQALIDQGRALAQEPAQPVVQEPAAWIVEFESGERELHWSDTKVSLGESQVPLYTAPQPSSPDRQALQAKGTHPAPCGRHCEATAFEIEIRGLKAQIACIAQPAAQEPVSKEAEWVAQTEHLNCPACGGSGHVGDVKQLTDKQIFKLASNYDCGMRHVNEQWAFNSEDAMLTFVREVEAAVLGEKP